MNLSGFLRDTGKPLSATASARKSESIFGKPDA